MRLFSKKQSKNVPDANSARIETHTGVTKRYRYVQRSVATGESDPRLLALTVSTTVAHGSRGRGDTGYT